MIKHLIVHCSDSPNDREIDAATIHLWHKERGFDGIGYHYVIRRNGILENGRPHYWKGAHAKKVNSESLGICLVGRDEFTPEQYGSLRMLLQKLKYDYPDAEIAGHYEYDDYKTCPNFDVKKWWG